MEKTLKEVKRDLKDLGYKVRTHRYSDFIAVSVTDQEGNHVNAGISSKEIYEANKRFFEYREQFRGKMFDGMTRIVL